MWTKILLIFFVFSFIFRTDFSFDQDLGRHIKLGEIISTTHQVPKVNLFSYTNPDFPFINTHWLFEVIAYFFYFTKTLQIFLILKVIILLISVWLILKTIPKENSALILLIGFIFLHVLRERLELRPEIFSFLFTAISYFILNKFLSGKTKLIWMLPIIQLIWINTHIYFFVGFLLQSIFLIHLSYGYIRHKEDFQKLKILFSVTTLSVLLSLINPNGIYGFLYPLTVNQNYGYTIVENQTMFLLESINFKDPNFLFVKLSILILVISVLLATIKKNISFKNILLIVLGLSLALMNVRSFPYLVFISLPAVLLSIPKIKKPNLFANLLPVINITIGSILLIESFFYLSGQYYRERDLPNNPELTFKESGQSAMDFVIKNDLPAPIFNNFDIGSYISFRGYPKYKNFVDGRPEAFPKDFFINIYMPMQNDISKFKEQEKLLSFQTIIFSHTDQTPWGQSFIKNIFTDESWVLVYIDDFIMVLVKNDIASQKHLSKINVATLKPSDFTFNNSTSYIKLGSFLINTNHSLEGKQFIEKALELNPKSKIANSFLGNF